MVKPSEITFVIQGPIIEGVTQTSCRLLREHFASSKILVSTWKGQPTNNIDFDKLVLNEDPGSTIVKFTKKNQPHTVNINRQIVSTFNGLKQVETKYAVKLRSDNYLTSNRLLFWYEQFSGTSSTPLPLKKRVLTTNLFAKEFVEGLPCPFFFSDFFMFGFLEDLLKIWDQPMMKNYKFNEKLSGKRQHTNYPWPQLHVEQWLVKNFVSKYMPCSLKHKYSNDEGQVPLSQKILANNFVVVEREMINLHVPDRLNQHEGFPYETYSFARWKHLQQRLDPTAKKSPTSLLFKLKWWSGRLAMYFKSGLKQQLRLAKCHISNS
jgi:hypothetical protein